MTVFYNEIDKFAAQWLRELIKQGHIADGVVDERSIIDVKPEELIQYTQCHFFAGIGVWSYALRQSGWSDDRPVWTGSCPCQPFSTAGKGKGFADERHLWPVFFNLIKECRPECVFGEQVAGKNGEIWLDAVQYDLESEAYTCGAAVTAACGFGAPHQRKRLYWVAEDTLADTNGVGVNGVRRDSGCKRIEGCEGKQEYDKRGTTNSMADNQSRGRREEQPNTGRMREGATTPQHETGGHSTGGTASSMADTVDQGSQGLQRPRDMGLQGAAEQVRSVGENSTSCRTFPTNGFWGNPDWLFCRDGKWRPVESGTFPLANGSAARVGRLRGYGNAIVSSQAEAFIESYMEVSL